MKFHIYQTLKQCVGADSHRVRRMSLQEFYDNEEAVRIKHPRRDDYDELVSAELNWLREDRPFYHVYPAITKCLKNTSLQVTLRQLGQFGTTAICFAEGHEPALTNGKLCAFLFGVFMQYQDLRTNVIHTEPTFHLVLDRITHDGRRCFSSMIGGGDKLISDQAANLKDDKARILSLGVGLALLSRDPRFTEPILLNRDATRHITTHEEMDVAIDRAKRRGVNGMTIGKHMEVSPHMRRPHFGIRWTGKGRETPKLVPITGCLVMRSRLFPIPTGYLGADETTEDSELV